MRMKPKIEPNAYTLTPKDLACTAALEAGLLKEDADWETFECFWKLFEDGINSRYEKEIKTEGRKRAVTAVVTTVIAIIAIFLSLTAALSPL